MTSMPSGLTPAAATRLTGERAVAQDEVVRTLIACADRADQSTAVAPANWGDQGDLSDHADRGSQADRGESHDGRPRWSTIELDARALFGHVEVHVALDDGRTAAPTRALIMAVTRLRQLSFQLGHGTWFRLAVRVARGAASSSPSSLPEVSLVADPDRAPGFTAFDGDFEEEVARDLRVFPRGPARRPRWMRRALEDLAERTAGQGSTGNASAPTSTAPNGSAPNGSAPNGSAPNGSAIHGSASDDSLSLDGAAHSPALAARRSAD